jgi:hypothetical protein
MKTEVATQLHSEAAERVKAKMKAKAEAEEAKLLARRGKQEQLLAIRAAKKARYRAAKDAEAVVVTICDELEQTAKARLAVSKDIAAVNAAVDSAAASVGVAKMRLAKAQEALEEAIKEQDKVRAATDVTIVEQKSQNLREAWGNSQAAWEKIQKGIRKRPAPEGKDRALAKRVKGLLG